MINRDALERIKLEGREAQRFFNGATLRLLLRTANIPYTDVAEMFNVTRMTPYNWCRLKNFNALRRDRAGKLLTFMRNVHSAILSYDLPIHNSDASWQEILATHVQEKTNERNRIISPENITN